MMREIELLSRIKRSVVVATNSDHDATDSVLVQSAMTTVLVDVSSVLIIPKLS